VTSAFVGAGLASFEQEEDRRVKEMIVKEKIRDKIAKIAADRSEGLCVMG
jgi:hypothetical protein